MSAVLLVVMLQLVMMACCSYGDCNVDGGGDSNGGSGGSSGGNGCSCNDFHDGGCYHIVWWYNE